MRFLSIITVLVSTFAASITYAETNLSGTWNVIATGIKEENTCQAETETSAYQWLIAQNGNKLDITVIGTTSFPKFTGTIDQKSGFIVISGLTSTPTAIETGCGSVKISNFVTMYLVIGKDGKLTGKRILAISEAHPRLLVTNCITTYTIEAKKQ